MVFFIASYLKILLGEDFSLSRSKKKKISNLFLKNGFYFVENNRSKMGKKITSASFSAPREKGAKKGFLRKANLMHLWLKMTLEICQKVVN